MVRISFSFVVLGSLISTALTIMNAFFLKKQFYTSVVYLTKSSTSMMVLYFQAAVLSYLVFSFIRWIFFGQLRPAEVERAQERVWHAIMETCLAFTVFRDDFSPKFVVQFVVLFFVKAFHWLAEDRVDYMERSPIITVLFHARILGVISLLGAIDSYFISHAFFTTLMRGASAQIVFGFEYAVLLTMVAHITINYLLHLYDLRSPHPWENKAVYMLYVELLTSFLRCALYLAFAVVMMKIHTFPLFALRPFYLTVKSFRKAVNDVILSRRAINAMNNLFPLATAQDLAESDNTCIICREEMTVESGVKKLPCNHIFHPNCLRSWFQRQQTCPTCRTDVLAATRRPHGLIPGAQQQQQQNGGVGGVLPPNIFAAPPPFQFQFNFGGLQQLRQQPMQQAAAVNVAAQQQPPPQFPPQFMPPYGFPMFPPQFFPPPQLQQQMQQQLEQQQRQQQQQTPSQQQQTSTATVLSNNQANGAIGNPPPTTSLQQNGQQASQSSAPPNNGEANSGDAQTGESSTHNNPQSSSEGGSQQTSQQQPTFTPFLPPPPPFGLFPPMPTPPSFPSFPLPPTFSGLSDAELSALEGTERRAVEARVQVLRNIQVLLDAAMLQFQQYLTFASGGSNMTQPAARESTLGSSQTSPPGTSSGGENVAVAAPPPPETSSQT